jgi:hypothetical protein
MIVGDRMTEKGQGGGNLVETFELHKITSIPNFRTPNRAGKGPEPILQASWVFGCAVSAMISSCDGPIRRGDY